MTQSNIFHFLSEMYKFCFAHTVPHRFPDLTTAGKHVSSTGEAFCSCGRKTQVEKYVNTNEDVA